jgi:hypothetical protein
VIAGRWLSAGQHGPRNKFEILLPPGNFVQLAIDVGDFFHPPLSFRVFETQDFAAWPVKVVGDVGYLLMQTVEGVAAYSPPSSAKSISNSALHSGHITGKVVIPSSLMRR